MSIVRMMARVLVIAMMAAILPAAAADDDDTASLVVGGVNAGAFVGQGFGVPVPHLPLPSYDIPNPFHDENVTGPVVDSFNPCRLDNMLLDELMPGHDEDPVPCDAGKQQNAQAPCEDVRGHIAAVPVIGGTIVDALDGVTDAADDILSDPTLWDTLEGAGLNLERWDGDAGRLVRECRGHVQDTATPLGYDDSTIEIEVDYEPEYCVLAELEPYCIPIGLQDTVVQPVEGNVTEVLTNECDTHGIIVTCTQEVAGHEVDTENVTQELAGNLPGGGQIDTGPVDHHDFDTDRTPQVNATVPLHSALQCHTPGRVEDDGTLRVVPVLRHVRVAPTNTPPAPLVPFWAVVSTATDTYNETVAEAEAMWDALVGAGITTLETLWIDTVPGADDPGASRAPGCDPYEPEPPTVNGEPIVG